MRKGEYKYNWSKIQTDYDNGFSYDDLVKKYNIAIASLAKARKRGSLITRSKSEALKLYCRNNPKTLSEETKRKISKSRLEYLEKNPDKVPYLLNHSSKMSYPEKLFQNALMKNGITGWTYNFQHGIYSYDFAFIDLKIDIEIDGSTHLTEKVKQIDKRRDKFSKKHGWIVMRFTAKEVKLNVQLCIDKLQKYLRSSVVRASAS